MKHVESQDERAWKTCGPCVGPARPKRTRRRISKHNFAYLTEYFLGLAFLPSVVMMTY